MVRESGSTLISTRIGKLSTLHSLSVHINEGQKLRRSLSANDDTRYPEIPLFFPVNSHLLPRTSFRPVKFRLARRCTRPSVMPSRTSDNIDPVRPTAPHYHIDNSRRQNRQYIEESHYAISIQT